ncbi:MAG: OsmC family protein [Bacteroidales bacterium]|nr:OsmC family protein [Bacteroidales bacterium]
MGDLIFKIEAQSESATKTRVKARNFELIIDEPESLGGTDKGANPVEYLLASYAGCLSVVAHITAQEKGIVLNDLQINISGNINPERFLGKSKKERAGFKKINVEITLNSDISNNEKIEWINEIIERCPVGDNLKNASQVSINIVQNKLQEINS